MEAFEEFLMLVNSIRRLTSEIDPWLQIVMAGNSISEMGIPVVRTVVRTGLSCQAW